MTISGLTVAAAGVQLERQAKIIAALAMGAGQEQAHWKPSADAWSIVEVVCHLVDEEMGDFRRRLDLTLHQPTADWPPIDPQGWVTARRYNERSLDLALRDFLDQRQASLEWLARLGPVDLDTAHTHPNFGSMAAGALLASWVAHDLLHIRQLNELNYLWWARTAQPYGVGYAGDW